MERERPKKYDSGIIDAQNRMRLIVRGRVMTTWNGQLNEFTLNEMIEMILDVINIVETHTLLTAWQIGVKLENKRIQLVDMPRRNSNWPGLDGIPEIGSFQGNGDFREQRFYHARRVNGLDVIGIVGRNPGLNTLEICVLLNMRRYRSDVAVNDILPNRDITEITATWPGLEGIPEIYMDYWGHFYLWNEVPLPDAGLRR